MNQKVEITKYIAEQLSIPFDKKKFKILLHNWWQNPMIKPQGGLKLTSDGYKNIKLAGLKEYKIRFEEPMHFQNKHIIWLDNFIDCPWYITNREMIVFGEKMAVQLVLFSGNVVRFTTAKSKNKYLT